MSKKFVLSFVVGTLSSTLMLSPAGVLAGSGEIEKFFNAAGRTAKGVVEDVIVPPVKAVAEVSAAVVKPVVEITVAPIAEGVIQPVVSGVADAVVAPVANAIIKPIGNEVSNGVRGAVKYIEENPVEAAFVIAFTVWGGYAILNPGQYDIYVQGIKVAGDVAGGVSIGTAATIVLVSDDEDEHSPAPPMVSDDDQVSTPDIEEVPGYLFLDVPERPSDVSTDEYKILYAREVQKFITDNPISIYGDSGLPEEITLQEKKILDVLILLKTVSESDGEILVRERNESGAPSEILEAVKDGFFEGGPAVAVEEGLKETLKQSFIPSVAGDASLNSLNYAQELAREMSSKLQEYINIRVENTPIVSKSPGTEESDKEDDLEEGAVIYLP